MAKLKYKVKKQWVVCNVDGSTHQKHFKVYQDLTKATVEAQRLASLHKENNFLLMEAIGGFIMPQGAEKAIPVEIETEPLYPVSELSCS
jgi:hypothetical protein